MRYFYLLAVSTMQHARNLYGIMIYIKPQELVSISTVNCFIDNMSIKYISVFATYLKSSIIMLFQLNTLPTMKHAFGRKWCLFYWKHGNFNPAHEINTMKLILINEGCVHTLDKDSSFLFFQSQKAVLRTVPPCLMVQVQPCPPSLGGKVYTKQNVSTHNDI